MKQYGPLVTTIAVATLTFGGVTGSALASESPPPGSAASTTEVRAEPAGLPGDNPFFTPAAAGTPVAVALARPSGVASGDAPGLYGGTLQNSCDSAGMVSFLQANPDRASAFATVEGIEPAAIADYVTGLTPVTLRADTAVTNHGFANGGATSLQSVLQAGTAVLVDQFGVPQVRCSCGNPLGDANKSNAGGNYSGSTWSGLSSDRVDVIRPASAPIREFVLTDSNDERFSRPTGSHGDKDSDSDHGGGGHHDNGGGDHHDSGGGDHHDNGGGATGGGATGGGATGGGATGGGA
ncbi:MAG TPA: DUF6777 domain-containing protein, partial [Pseudonocardia sp.]|nr:DUF6777 domain-containing protein [Pseudonocardia sp.]